MSSIVQQPTPFSDTTTSTTAALAFGAAPTVGNTMLAIIRGANWSGASGQSISSVVDDATGGSNTWTLRKALPAVTPDDKNRIEYWTAPVTRTKTGGLTVTATYSSTCQRREVQLIEISGLDNAALLMDSVSAQGSSATPSAGNLTVTGGGARIFASFVVNDNYRSGSAGSGYTSISAANFWTFALHETKVAAAGTVAADFTVSPSNTWAAMAIALKESASAPVLSSPTATATGNTTGIGTVSTTGTDGVIWRKAAATAQTDPGGGLEAGAGWTSQAVTASGAQSFSSLGTLTTNTSYVVSYFHVSAAGLRGSVVTSAAFTPPTMASSGTLPAQSGTASSAFTYAGATPESQITVQGVGSSSWNLTNAGGSGLSTINGASGVPGGTLTATPGTYTVTVTKIDSSTAGTNPTGGGSPPQTIVRTFSLTVNASGATAVTLSGPSSGTVGSPSTAFTVGANGVISGTVTVTPSDAGNGGTFTPATVNISSGAPTATFTYTAASAGAKTISVTNSGSLTNPGSLTYTAGGVATAITLTGPTVGLAGVASSAFTVSANGVITGTVTVTPSAAGCTFSPTSVNISAGTPTATFTCTPAATGAKTITLANNGSLSNPSAYTYQANAALATTLNITLTTDGVTPAANLTGLKVAVYDYPTPDLWAGKTPIYTTGNGVTNASGVYSCSISGLTALAPGGIAGIAISSSDGTLTQGSAQKGYVGPVAVS